MASETANGLRLNFCPDCGYDLTGGPAEYRCPECGFYYDSRFFDLPPHRGVGKFRPLRRRQWIDWVLRPVLYVLIPVGLLFVGYRLGVPVGEMLPGVIKVAAFCAVMFVMIRVSRLIDDKRTRSGKPRGGHRRAVTSAGLVNHGPDYHTWSINWRSCRAVQLTKLGDYVESGLSLWRLKLIRRSWFLHVLGRQLVFRIVCSESVAISIRDRVSAFIADAGSE